MRLLLYIVVTFIVGYLLLLLGALGAYLFLVIVGAAVFYGVHLLHDLHKHLIKVPPHSNKAKAIADQYKKELAEKEAQM